MSEQSNVCSRWPRDLPRRPLDRFDLYRAVDQVLRREGTIQPEDIIDAIMQLGPEFGVTIEFGVTDPRDGAYAIAVRR